MSTTPALKNLFDKAMNTPLSESKEGEPIPHIYGVLGESKAEVLGVSNLNERESALTPKSKATSSGKTMTKEEEKAADQKEMEAWLKRNDKFMSGQTPEEQKAIKSWKTNRYKQKAFGITGQLKPGQPYNREKAIRHGAPAVVKSPDQRSLQTSKLKVLNMIKVTKKRAASGTWKRNWRRSMKKREDLGIVSRPRKYNPKQFKAASGTRTEAADKKFYQRREEFMKSHGGEKGAQKYIDDLVKKDAISVRSAEVGKKSADAILMASLTPAQKDQLSKLKGLARAKKLRELRRKASPSTLDQMDKVMGGHGSAAAAKALTRNAKSKPAPAPSPAKAAKDDSRRSRMTNTKEDDLGALEAFYCMPSQDKLNEAIENDYEYTTYEDLFENFLPDFDVSYYDNPTGAVFSLLDDEGDTVLTFSISEDNGDDLVSVFVGEGYEYLQELVDAYEDGNNAFLTEELEDFLADSSDVIYGDEDDSTDLEDESDEDSEDEDDDYEEDEPETDY